MAADPTATGRYVGKNWDFSWPSAFFSLKLGKDLERFSDFNLKASRAKSLAKFELFGLKTSLKKLQACRMFQPAFKTSGEGSRLDTLKEWVHTRHFEDPFSSGVSDCPSSPTKSVESILIAARAITIYQQTRIFCTKERAKKHDLEHDLFDEVRQHQKGRCYA